MERMTVTELFAEIKLTREKVLKKNSSILKYAAVAGKLRDPLERQGGSEAFIKAETQAVRDLQARLVRMLTAMHKSNMKVQCTIEGETKSVYEWLVWRKEIFPALSGHYGNLLMGAQTIRANEQRSSAMANSKSQDGTAPEVVVQVFFDEKQTMAEAEKLTAIYQKLDGQLSLLNATTVVEF
jgi:hypothetical protein